MEEVVMMSKKQTDQEHVDEPVLSDIDLNESHELEDVTPETLEIEALHKKIESLQEALDTVEARFKNDYVKAYADMENMKKRLQRENEQQRKYRIQSFAMSVLPVIDNLERALAQDSDQSALKEGVQMIYDQLMNALLNEGVSVIEAQDQPFDPNIHQAVMAETIEGVEPGIVLEELQKGYMLKDRILRATMVKVSQ